MNEQDILSDGVQIALTQENSSVLLQRHNAISITLERKISLLIFLRYILSRITECFEKEPLLKGTTLRVYIYGSLCMGTSLNDDSDIDVEMKIIGKENIPYKHVLNSIKRLQNRLYVQNLQFKPIINNTIRVPLVSFELDASSMLQLVNNVASLGSKIFYPNENHQYDGMVVNGPSSNSKNSNTLKMDLIYDNQLGVLNSQLLRRYMDINPKIVVLCLIFKDWASAHNLKSARKLTSYALSNMVLYYLIKQGYICSLQDDEFFGFERTDEKLTVFECMQEKKFTVTTSFLSQRVSEVFHEAVQSKLLRDLEEVTIDSLFIGLIKFYEDYSMRLWKHEVVERISTRPEYLKKQENPQSYYQEKKIISIQDPFEPEYDVGSRNDFKLIEFINAILATIQWIEG